jgi:hypothetical protein
MFSEIRAVFSRRYLLQSTGLEVFMANRSKTNHLKNCLMDAFIVLGVHQTCMRAIWLRVFNVFKYAK